MHPRRRYLTGRRGVPAPVFLAEGKSYPTKRAVFRHFGRRGSFFLWENKEKMEEQKTLLSKTPANIDEGLEILYTEWERWHNFPARLGGENKTLEKTGKTGLS